MHLDMSNFRTPVGIDRLCTLPIDHICDLFYGSLYSQQNGRHRMSMIDGKRKTLTPQDLRQISIELQRIAVSWDFSADQSDKKLRPSDVLTSGPSDKK